MSITGTFVYASVRAFLHTIRNARTRVFLLLLFLGGVAFNSVSFSLLRPGMDFWLTHHQERSMILPLLGGWMVCGFLALLAMWQNWLNPDKALYLFLLPQSSAALFRNLYLITLVDRVGVRVVILLSGLMLALLSSNPIWFLLFLTGACFFVLCGLIGCMLFYLCAMSRLPVIIATLGGVAILSDLLVVFVLHQGWRSLPSVFFQPLVWSALFFLGTVVLLTLSARAWGRLYILLYQRIQSHTRRQAGKLLPGIGLFTTLTARSRTLVGALLFKGALVQSRNPLNSIRVISFFLSIFVFLLLHTMFADRHISDGVLVLAYGTILGVYFFLDGSPSPFGSEGSRLSLYLLAPISSAGILWAKFITQLAVVLPLVLALCLICGVWLHLPVPTLLFVVVAVALIIGNVTAFMVWGSMWDEDLKVFVEGNIQSILQEQLPSTARRLVIIGSCALLALAEFVLVNVLIAPLALLALAVCTLIITVGTWKFAHWYLRQLLQRG